MLYIILIAIVIIYLSSGRDNSSIVGRPFISTIGDRPMFYVGDRLIGYKIRPRRDIIITHLGALACAEVVRVGIWHNDEEICDTIVGLDKYQIDDFCYRSLPMAILLKKGEIYTIACMANRKSIVKILPRNDDIDIISTCWGGNKWAAPKHERAASYIPIGATFLYL